MIVEALLLIVQSAPALPLSAPPPPVADWPTLPPLPWRTPPVLLPEVTAFVAGEVAAGRCHATGLQSLSLDLIVAIGGDSMAERTIPRSIDCPSVEQFAVGLVTGFARNNLRDTAPGWYRLTVSFTLPAAAPQQ